MSPLRARMIEDMTLAGLAQGTQKIYAQAVFGKQLLANARLGPEINKKSRIEFFIDVNEAPYFPRTNASADHAGAAPRRGRAGWRFHSSAGEALEQASLRSFS